MRQGGPWPRPGREAWYLLQANMHQGGLEKEVVDEIIFRTTNPRNRLMLELMARGGMRVSEVLKLTPKSASP